MGTLISSMVVGGCFRDVKREFGAGYNDATGRRLSRYAAVVAELPQVLDEGVEMRLHADRNVHWEEEGGGRRGRDRVWSFERWRCARHVVYFL